MSPQKINPLRELSEEEKHWLERISRSYSEPAAHVTRAKEILAVAGGSTYQEAAEKAGRKSGDAVSQLVGRFNKEGMLAIQGHPGGKPTPKYQANERERVIAEARRQPDPEKDGTDRRKVKHGSGSWNGKTPCCGRIKKS
jgi:transposase